MRPRSMTAVGAMTAIALTAGAVLAAPPPANAHETAGDAADHGEYVVRPGDTLSVIALELATSVQTLVALNSIGDADRIHHGQALRVPGSRDGATAPAASSTHVVAAGESLSQIAARYGVTTADLAAANGITDVNSVWAGRRLTVASEAPALAAPAASSAHVVAAGESLSQIAARYGVTTADLAAANGITDFDRVYAGTSLSVPGGWHCPTPEVTRFVDDFGVPKRGGRFHDGVDLFAPRGSPVVAPVAGSVEQLEGRRGGKQFVLEGVDGHRYIGTHLDSLGAGGSVTAGTVLGTVGDTGNARGSDPHLHFEIHPNDGPAANPYPVLVKACPGS